jgi:hypothetical protein
LENDRKISIKMVANICKWEPSIKEKPKRKGRRRISVGQFGASAGGENRSELRKSNQPDYD